MYFFVFLKAFYFSFNLIFFIILGGGFIDFGMRIESIKLLVL